VIRRLQGFGCRVLACDDNRDTMEGAEVTSLPRLLSESDIVTLHVPLTTDSHHLIGREQIARMKQGAVLVNTGRGALVDSGTLLDALESRHLGGVALDVLEGEEGIFYLDRRTTPVDHQPLQRLLQLPNAIVTPHTAYYTRRALTEIVEQTLIHCLRFERSRAGEPAHDRDLVRR